MSWIEFIAAFVVFYLSHSIPVRRPVRNRLLTALGRRGFLIAYSALSLSTLTWLIVAAGRAPYIQIWPSAAWQAWVPLAIMLVVCLIVAFSVGKPNPFSFGGSNNDRFDPARPGIVRWLRHPFLIALGLWAAAHIVPNGDIAHILLFTPLALFAFAGQWLIDLRKQHEYGQQWHLMVQAIQESTTPLTVLTRLGFYLRCMAALLLYGGLIWLHPVLLGVNPLP